MTALWHCDYCGHQQDADARKCADCGGPRGEKVFDPREWRPGECEVGHYHSIKTPIDWGLYQEYLTGERIKAQNAISEHVHDVRVTVVDVLTPILEECADRLSRL